MALPGIFEALSADEAWGVHRGQPPCLCVRSLICPPALALTAMRRLTPASLAHRCFPVTAPCSPVLVFDLPCSREVIGRAVFARQQAERDMEQGPSRATAIRAMQMLCRGGRRHERGQNIAHVFSKEKLMTAIIHPFL